MDALSLGLGVSVPAAWLTLAVGLLIVEVLHPAGFCLSFAVAAAVLSVKAYGFANAPEAPAFLDEAMFAILGVVLIAPLRRLILRFANKTPNINDLSV